MSEEGEKTYKYRDSGASTVTQEEWDKMSPAERLAKFKAVSGALTDADAARLLNTTAHFLQRYRTCTSMLGAYLVNRMRNVCVDAGQRPLREYMALNSIAIDSALDVFDNMLGSGNLVSLNMSCYTLAVKIAATADKLLLTPAVASLGTYYGVDPAYTMVHLDFPGTSVTADIKVTYLNPGGKTFVARVNVLEAGVVKKVFAYTLSDRAVHEILYRIDDYLNKYGTTKSKRDSKGRNRVSGNRGVSGRRRKAQPSS